MRKQVITVAYRIVHGNAKNYSYWGAKSYRLKMRKDGIYTYRPGKEYGPDRRSYKLAIQDAKQWAAKLHVAYEPNIRLGTIPVDTPKKQILVHCNCLNPQRNLGRYCKNN